MHVGYTGTTRGGGSNVRLPDSLVCEHKRMLPKRLFWESTSKHEGQAPFQKPAPCKRSVFPPSLLALQHPLRRQHLANQPFFQHGRLIEGFGQCLENRFHDVVRVAAIHQIDMEIQTPVGHEGLEEVFE